MDRCQNDETIQNYKKMQVWPRGNIGSGNKSTDATPQIAINQQSFHVLRRKTSHFKIICRNKEWKSVVFIDETDLYMQAALLWLHPGKAAPSKLSVVPLLDPQEMTASSFRGRQYRPNCLWDRKLKGWSDTSSIAACDEESLEFWVVASFMNETGLAMEAELFVSMLERLDILSRPSCRFQFHKK